MKGLIGSEMKEAPQVNAEVLVKALNGVKGMLYKEGLIEKIADMIGGGRDAAATISDMVAMLAGEIKKQFADIDSQTLFVFAVYATAEIVRSLKETGLVEDAKSVATEAIEGAVMKFIQDNPDSIDPNTVQGVEPTEDDIKRGERLMTGVAV